MKNYFQAIREVNFTISLKDLRVYIEKIKEEYVDKYADCMLKKLQNSMQTAQEYVETFENSSISFSIE